MIKCKIFVKEKTQDASRYITRGGRNPVAAAGKIVQQKHDRGARERIDNAYQQKFEQNTIEYHVSPKLIHG